MLKVIYAFFVGLLLAIFVGVGISTFYAEPKLPDPPAAYERGLKTDDPEFQQQDDVYVYMEQLNKYNADLSDYSRNVSIVALVAAVGFVTAGLAFATRIRILSDGLLLGGVFTLMYSLARGFMTDENMYRFMIVSAGLVVALVLGYVKFIKPEQKQVRKKSRR